MLPFLCVWCLVSVMKPLWFHCCVDVYFSFLWWLSIVWIIPPNQFCTWDLQILNYVLWKRIQYYFKYCAGQMWLLLTYLIRNQMLPRFISFSSREIQHKITFCPMLLSRILVIVVMRLTHYINHYLSLRTLSLCSQLELGTAHSDPSFCLCHYASPINLTWSHRWQAPCSTHPWSPAPSMGPVLTEGLLGELDDSKEHGIWVTLHFCLMIIFKQGHHDPHTDRK